MTTWTEKVSALLDEALTDAHGDDEQLWALRQAFSDGVEFPAQAQSLGDAVEVVEVDYDGHERRGLFARCSRRGMLYEMSASDVVFEAGSVGALHVDAYRKWLGMEPIARDVPAASDFALDEPLEVVVVRPRDKAVRVRVLPSGESMTLRCAGVGDLVPGEVATIQPNKRWSFKGHPYLSGDVLAHRVDAAALGLAPLELLDEWPWDPDEEYWGEDDEPPDWAEPMIAAGVRSSFEMETVAPHAADPYADPPILMAIGMYQRGEMSAARELLYDMLEDDLRCLDAHAHLGSWELDFSPRRALRHFEVGLRIGEFALGDAFDGVLQWGRLDNRPFHRCLHGYGLALWRLQRWEEAAVVFERMLWLNPADNLGARFLLPEIRGRVRWEDTSV